MDIDQLRRRFEREGEAGGDDPATLMTLMPEDIKSPSVAVDLKVSSAYRTTLQLAADCGLLDIVGVLLGHGADVNTSAKPYFGRTALQAAAGSGCIPVMKELLAKGARVNGEISPVGGHTAFQLASWGGHLDAVKLLL